MMKQQVNFKDSKTLIPNNTDTQLSFTIQKQMNYDLIRCIQDNKAFQFCLNQQCDTTMPFMCHQDNCNCHNFHKDCQKMKISKVLQIRNKINLQSSFIKQQVYGSIEKQILMLKNTRENLISTIQEIKLNQIHEIQSKYFKLFLNQDYIKFQSLNYSRQVNIQSLNQYFLVQSSNINQNSGNKPFCRIKQIFKEFDKTFTLDVQDLVQKIKFIKYSDSITIDNLITNSLNIEGSSIIDSEQYYGKLINLFPNKIKSMSLIFKASENQFSMQKYYQKCGFETNTIIISLNNKDKILGGYTPLSFAPINQVDSAVSDPSQSSFVFSLTTNQKFILKNRTQFIVMQIKIILILDGIIILYVIMLIHLLSLELILIQLIMIVQIIRMIGNRAQKLSAIRIPIQGLNSGKLLKQVSSIERNILVSNIKS